jgi:drug/metabolite transporter (DMT)-like permease
VARFVLHEQISLLRWLGIVLITSGVGFVAGGPALTEHPLGEAGKIAEGSRAEKSPPFDSAQGKLLAKDARNGAPQVGITGKV